MLDVLESDAGRDALRGALRHCEGRALDCRTLRDVFDRTDAAATTTTTNSAATTNTSGVGLCATTAAAAAVPVPAPPVPPPRSSFSRVAIANVVTALKNVTANVMDVTDAGRGGAAAAAAAQKDDKGKDKEKKIAESLWDVEDVRDIGIVAMQMRED